MAKETEERRKDLTIVKLKKQLKSWTKKRGHRVAWKMKK